jgi:hypothetical protein
MLTPARLTAPNGAVCRDELYVRAPLDTTNRQRYATLAAEGVT